MSLLQGATPPSDSVVDVLGAGAHAASSKGMAQPANDSPAPQPDGGEGQHADRIGDGSAEPAGGGRNGDAAGDMGPPSPSGSRQDGQWGACCCCFRRYSLMEM